MIERETHNKAVNLPRIPGRQEEIRRTWAALDAELDRMPGNSAYQQGGQPVINPKRYRDAAMILICIALAIIAAWCQGCVTQTYIKGSEIKSEIENYSKDIRHLISKKEYVAVDSEWVRKSLHESGIAKKQYDVKKYNCRHFALNSYKYLYSKNEKAAVGYLKLVNTRSGVLKGAGPGVRMDNHMMIWFINSEGVLEIIEPQRYWWDTIRGDKIESFRPFLYFSR